MGDLKKLITEIEQLIFRSRRVSIQTPELIQRSL